MAHFGHQCPKPEVCWSNEPALLQGLVGALGDWTWMNLSAISYDMERLPLPLGQRSTKEETTIIGAS